MGKGYWITGTSGDWSTAADWVSGVVPGSTDDVFVNDSSGVPITVTGTATADSLSLNGSTLTVSGALTLGTSLIFNDDGELALDGGTLSAPSIAASNFGRLSGFGTVIGAVNGNIQIEAEGGTLKVEGPVSGASGVSISSGATLELSDGTNAAVTFGALSTLKLDAPTAFTGAIPYFTLGDRIDLAGIIASSATYIGTTLTINETNGQQLTYNNVSVDIPADEGDILTVASDNNGGTDVYWIPPPETWITGTSGDWSTAADWVSGVVPGSTDDVFVNDSSGVPITVTGTATADSLSLNGSTLTVSGALTLGTSLIFNDDGELALDGGTLSAPSIAASNFGRLSGFGTVIGAVNGNIQIEAEGGTLKVEGPVSGASGVSISSGATLELSDGTNAAVTFGALSTLKLDAPTAFTGAIPYFTLGDRIDLAGIIASSATYIGTTLTINETNGQQLTYNNVSVDIPADEGDILTVASDNNGGTDVYWTTGPVVSSVTATTNNGATDIDAGHVVTITVDTSEPVTVTGTPTLQLNDSEVATYVSGSDTDTLTFTYTVLPGDNVSDLKVTGLNLPNGATIEDPAGTAMAGSVWQDLTLQIDTTPPAVIYTYQTINPPGSTYSIAENINDNGQIVGLYQDSNGRQHGFLDSGGVYTTIDPPGSIETIAAWAINNSGQIIGWYDNSSGQEGFLDSDGTYTAIDPPDSNSTAPISINASGQIVGTYRDGNGAYHSFLYSGGAYTILDVPGAIDTYATNINDEGQIVGVYQDSNGQEHGFVDNNGSYTTIDPPGSLDTIIKGISENGQIVGYYQETSGGAEHGFLYGNGIYTILDFPGAIDTVADSVNESGQVTGYYVNGSSTQSFVYSDGEYTTIDSPGGLGSTANSINDGRQIVGSYGSNFGFLAIPPVTATTDNGANDLNAGHAVTITVDATEMVTVIGTPTLQLNDNEVAAYQSGTGTDALTFTYTVQPGDNTNDLQVIGLNLPNGATIEDGAGNALTGSVAQDLALQIDTTPPTVIGLYAFTTVQDPPAQDANNTSPTGINNEGQIVGWYQGGSSSYYGFVYSGGSYTNFYGDNGTPFTFALGINDEGQVVGEYNTGSSERAFLYSGSSYTTIEGPQGAISSNATGINDVGQILGNYSDSNNYGRGFIYSGGTYTIINDPLAGPENGTVVAGINEGGQIVGNYADSNNVENGFLYSGGNYTTIDDPLGTSTVAQGINDLGQIVGSYFDSNGVQHGFLYSNGSYITINDPSGTSTNVLGINNAGVIVGDYRDSNGNYHGFLAATPVTASTATTDGGATELDTGHVLTITVDMSEPVMVSGTPTLQLNDNEVATYQSGSGTDALTFTYTVQPGDYTNDLQVTGLNLPNGASIEDQAGNALTGSVAQDLALQIDTTVTTVGTGESPSAAPDWFQFAGIPQSITTTNLVPSTDPNGGGEMMHVIVSNGGQLGNTYGNGFGQLFASDVTDATLTFDILVTSGQVTAGLVSTSGPFASGAETFYASPNWQQFSEQAGPDEGVYFETITSTLSNAEYFVDNVVALNVSALSSGNLLGNGNFDTTSETAPCYCQGTQIRTDRGEVRVEELSISDVVMTGSGAARPIKWIGRRSYSGRFVLGRRDILPICIKAGAIDENVPRRDLWISPHHAMYLEGVLIEAKDLVNGVSIVQAERVDKVEYFHIELETHDIIIAEGGPSESFIDDDDRGMFHNAHEYCALYPDAPKQPARYCAPRLDAG